MIAIIIAIAACTVSLIWWYNQRHKEHAARLSGRSCQPTTNGKTVSTINPDECIAETHRGNEEAQCSAEFIVITGCDSGIGNALARHLLERASPKMRLIVSCLDVNSKQANELRRLGINVVHLNLIDNASIDQFSKEVEKIIDNYGSESSHYNDKIKTRIGVNDSLLCHDYEGNKKLGNSGSPSSEQNNGVYSRSSGDSSTFAVSQQRRQGKAVLRALVSNAGVCVMANLDWQTDEQIETTFRVNVIGTVRLIRRMMMRIVADRARIVTVSSVNALITYPGLGAYSASKAAIEAVSDALRMELARFGVVVVKIRPGDYARLTGVMSRQQAHADAMWSAMSAEQQSRAGGRRGFDAYHRRVTENSGMCSPKNFGALMYCFEQALFEPRPRAAYLAGRLDFLVFMRVLIALPESLRYRVVGWIFAKALSDNCSNDSALNKTC